MFRSRLVVPIRGPVSRTCSHLRNLQMRFKSSSARQGQRTDDFPYSRLHPTQLERMSEDLGRSPLPLRTFFARHRPLMYMPQPMEQTDLDRELGDNYGPQHVLYVNVWQPGSEAAGFHEHPVRAVPHNIAGALGAFDVTKSTRQLARDSEDAEAAMFTANAGNRNNALLSSEVHESIRALASLLERRKDGDSMAGAWRLEGPTLVRIEPEEFMDGAEDAGNDHEVHATSVRRKRKLKMNRHKYRKRLKVQRTQRRRLGK